MARREFRLFAGVALALLVCIAVVTVQETFVHTDDGCAVELHCISCRWAVSSVPVIGDLPCLAASYHDHGAIALTAGPAGSEGFLHQPCSRGPPAPSLASVV